MRETTATWLGGIRGDGSGATEADEFIASPGSTSSSSDSGGSDSSSSSARERSERERERALSLHVTPSPSCGMDPLRIDDVYGELVDSVLASGGIRSSLHLLQQMLRRHAESRAGRESSRRRRRTNSGDSAGSGSGGDDGDDAAAAAADDAERGWSTALKTGLSALGDLFSGGEKDEGGSKRGPQSARGSSVNINVMLLPPLASATSRRAGSPRELPQPTPVHVRNSAAGNAAAAAAAMEFCLRPAGRPSTERYSGGILHWQLGQLLLVQDLPDAATACLSRVDPRRSGHLAAEAHLQLALHHLRIRRNSSLARAHLKQFARLAADQVAAASQADDDGSGVLAADDESARLRRPSILSLHALLMAARAQEVLGDHPALLSAIDAAVTIFPASRRAAWLRASTLDLQLSLPPEEEQTQKKKEGDDRGGMSAGANAAARDSDRWTQLAGAWDHVAELQSPALPPWATLRAAHANWKAGSKVLARRALLRALVQATNVPALGIADIDEDARVVQRQVEALVHPSASDRAEGGGTAVRRVPNGRTLAPSAAAVAAGGLGQISEGAGETKEAKRWYLLGAALEPTNQQCHTLAARLLLAEQRPSEASRLLNGWWKRRGEALSAATATSASATALATRRRGSPYESHGANAGLCSSNREMSEEESARSEQPSAVVLALLAETLASQGFLDDAVSAYEAALNASSGLPRSLPGFKMAPPSHAPSVNKRKRIGSDASEECAPSENDKIASLLFERAHERFDGLAGMCDVHSLSLAERWLTSSSSSTPATTPTTATMLHPREDALSLRQQRRSEWQAALARLHLSRCRPHLAVAEAQQLGRQPQQQQQNEQLLRDAMREEIAQESVQMALNEVDVLVRSGRSAEAWSVASMAVRLSTAQCTRQTELKLAVGCVRAARLSAAGTGAVPDCAAFAENALTQCGPQFRVALKTEGAASAAGTGAGASWQPEAFMRLAWLQGAAGRTMGAVKLYESVLNTSHAAHWLHSDATDAFRLTARWRAASALMHVGRWEAASLHYAGYISLQRRIGRMAREAACAPMWYRPSSSALTPTPLLPTATAHSPTAHHSQAQAQHRSPLNERARSTGAQQCTYEGAANGTLHGAARGLAATLYGQGHRDVEHILVLCKRLIDSAALEEERIADRGSRSWTMMGESGSRTIACGDVPFVSFYTNHKSGVLTFGGSNNASESMESVDLDILQHVLQAVGESFEQGQDASAAASAFARAAEMAQALARIDGAAAEAAAATKAALDAAAASRAERQAQSTQTQQQRAARVQQQHEQHSRGESTTRTSVQRVEKEKEKDKVAVRRTSPSEEEAKLLYKQGSALYAAGEYARAAVVLQQVMNLMPKHAGAAGNLAACHFQCVYLFSDALPPLCPRKMHVCPPHWLTFSVLSFFIFPPLLSLLFSFSLRFFVSHTHTHTHSLSLSKGSATWRPQSK